MNEHSFHQPWPAVPDETRAAAAGLQAHGAAGGTYTPSPAAQAPQRPIAAAGGAEPQLTPRRTLRGLDVFNQPEPVPEEGSELVPLQPLVPDVREEPFPTGHLPALIRNAVEEVASITQAPEAMVVSCALGAVAAAVQALVNVRRDTMLVGPVSLNILALAESGERKTTVDNYFTRGLREWQARKQKEMQPNVQTRQAQIDGWLAIEAGYKEALKRAAKEGNQSDMDALTRQLNDHALKRPQLLHLPVLIREDDTPERLANALTEWPVVTITSSEAGIIFGSHGMSPDVAMRNLAQTNKLWEAGEIMRGRVGGGDITVRDSRVSMCLQIQPETFLAFFEKVGALARGIGYLARFLVCYPESTQGRRFYEAPPATTPALDAFNRRIGELLDRIQLDEAGRVRVSELRIGDDQKALETWIGFYNSVEAELAEGGEYADLKDVASKAADNAARIWGLFFVFCWGTGEDTLSHMVNATQIMRWYLNAARRFRLAVALPEGVRQAKQLEDWLCRECIERRLVYVPINDILKLGPKGLRAGKLRDEAIEVLVEHGRAWLGRQGKKKHVVILHPEVLCEHGWDRRADGDLRLP